MQNTSILYNRAVITLEGKDTIDFLQAITTQDMLNQDKPQYALILTPQGKYFCDLFVLKILDIYYIDVPKNRLEEIISYLKLYILRKNVIISQLSEFAVIYSENQIANEISFCDPRSEKLGFRTFIGHNKIVDFIEDDSLYHKARFSIKLPDGDTDLIPNKSFPLHYQLDKFNAISFTKGCYIGQEVVSRMKYKLEIKKKVFYVETLAANLPPFGSIIMIDNEEIGMMLSSYKNSGLALINTDKFANILDKRVFCNDIEIKLQIDHHD